MLLLAVLMLFSSAATNTSATETLPDFRLFVYNAEDSPFDFIVGGSELPAEKPVDYFMLHASWASPFIAFAIGATLLSLLLAYVIILRSRLQHKTVELSITVDTLHTKNTLLIDEMAARSYVEREKEELTTELKRTIENIRIMSGMLPICSNCKKIRDDRGFWNNVETFISRYSNAEFTHSICPDCMKSLYPEYNIKIDHK
jgi:hypothetical protein